MTFYFECSAEGWQHHESEDWGRCQRFLEVLDDQMAGRQIDVYRGDRVLVYDRTRPADRHGRLIGLRFSLKDKWRTHFAEVREISASDFEEVWGRNAARAGQQADADGA